MDKMVYQYAHRLDTGLVVDTDRLDDEIGSISGLSDFHSFVIWIDEEEVGEPLVRTGWESVPIMLVEVNVTNVQNLVEVQ